MYKWSEQFNVVFLPIIVLKSASYINNWLVNHWKANSSVCLVSTLLIRKADIVERDDPWLLYLKEGMPVRTKQGPHYWLCYKATFFSLWLSLKARKGQASFDYPASGGRRERSQKNKESAESDLKGNGAQDELFEIRSSADVCVILL